MASKKPSAPNQAEIPDIIVHSSLSPTIRYEKGRFLGKGGFAKCYEVKNISTGEIVACKIVPKSLLTKQNQKDKMTQEIILHKSLSHPCIVKMFSHFDDANFVYITLELCSKRSLMELHKRRKAITEPETRYFMHQILLGVQYLHHHKIIHRDLKLGNIFLNDCMEIKLGDFGLATKLEFDGERKKTLCGTPNYIAPEVLNKKGHSLEVDIWSLGCILFTLLVGNPPFETQTLKETYNRIKKNEYYVPSKVGPLAKRLITKLLQSDPSKRPNVDCILKDEFMTVGFMPHRLPTSCLTMAPRFDGKAAMNAAASRGPLQEINKGTNKGSLASKPSSTDSSPKDYYLSELYKQLRTVLASNPASRAVPILEDEAEDPRVAPMIWVSKWVDYSDKYGFGYSLSDESIGVVFNDLTRLMLLRDGSNIQYIDYEGGEHYYTSHVFPPELEKKMKLLNYFKNYMREHLLKAGESIRPNEGDELSRIPWLKTWFRTSRAVVMHITNGTLQINFFKDHAKLILDPLLGGVTFIDEQRNHRTFSFELIEKYGCSSDLASRLTYAMDKVETMINGVKI